MASDTNINLRNQVMYSVYVRNHTPEGTFKALEKDLPRIKQMGVDVIWPSNRSCRQKGRTWMPLFN